MQNASSSLGSRHRLWPVSRPQQVSRLRDTPLTNHDASREEGSRRCPSAPSRRSRQLLTLFGATASEIIAEVLNEERKRENPASLLELLDRQGWGVAASITRKYSTKFASVALEASWDDDPTGRVQSRRLAVLAVHQEWLVGRSTLVGRLVDSLERLRPGYLPRELVERVSSSRSASLLNPDTEALDGPSLALLAALVVPPAALTRLLDTALADTRAELLASPAYRGRDDLVPSLDRGLMLLRASAVRALHLALFRATHLREATELEAELRRQRLAARSPAGEEAASGVLGMWFRSPKTPEGGSGSGGSGPQGAPPSTRAANERLYTGQLAAEAPRWMTAEERAATAAATAGRSGPRGLPGGRVGVVSFRPLPGAALYSDPGRPGGGCFGSSFRAAFSELDASVTDLLTKADYDVPAAALSTFARLHRTALIDLLAGWQWRQLAAVETDPVAVAAGGVRGFYVPTCSHAVSLQPPGPLQVGRRTRLEVAPGPELDSLRALARRRGSEVLAVVHQLARKQVAIQGEWEYWRHAYRLWERFAPTPPYFRTASLALVLTPEQVPYVGLLEAEAAGRAAAASVAVPPSAAAADDVDMSSLTSMSSLDFDDAPLPVGLNLPGTTAAAATTSGAAAGGGGGKPSVLQTETTVQIFLPPDELRRFLLVLLDLLPRHVGEAAAAAPVAASGGSGGGSRRAAGGPAAARRPSLAAVAAAAAAAPGEWLPADATTLQVRYCPVGAGLGEGPLRPSAASSPSSAYPPPSSSPSTRLQKQPPPQQRLAEETRPSCYELRWALGSATLTTEPSGPAAAAAYSRLNLPTAAAGGGGGGYRRPGGSPVTVAAARSAATAATVRWCAPMRLSQAHLVSLVNIFTDLAQRLPEQYGIAPQQLVVPTLSPLERLASAARAVAESVARAAGLLALLAVPLAAAIKAGGGHLNAMIGAPALATVAPGRVTGGGAAAATVRYAQVPLRDAAAVQRSTPSAEAAAATTVAAPQAPPVEELAALCRAVEEPLKGRMWLEVSGTSAAATVRSVLPRWLESAGGSLSTDTRVANGTGVPAVSWPEFQLVVEQPGGAVLGCRPVNAAARAVLAEVPLAAALRGLAAERAVAGHLEGLSRERIERGKATPGRFDLPYQAAKFRRLPTAAAIAAVAAPLEQQQHQSQQQQELRQPQEPHVSEAAVVAVSRPSAALVDASATAANEGAAEADAASCSDNLATTPTHTARALASPRPHPHAQQQTTATATAVSAPSARQPADGREAAAAASSAMQTAEGLSVAGEAETVPSLASTSTSAAPPASAVAMGVRNAATVSAAPVVVLKLELRPSLDPARHAVQGKVGSQQREYAQADVIVRPWYDSDSLLCWLEGGVQLPSLGPEMAAGLLAREEDERKAFLQAYERLSGRATAGGTVSTSFYDGDGDAATVDATGTLAEPGSAAASDPGLGGCAAGDGPVLGPQQLSDRELQEALRQLLLVLGVPEIDVRVAASGASSASPSSSAAAGATPAASGGGAADAAPAALPGSSSGPDTAVTPACGGGGGRGEGGGPGAAE